MERPGPRGQAPGDYERSARVRPGPAVVDKARRSASPAKSTGVAACIGDGTNRWPATRAEEIWLRH
ncbi:hypothetical protein ABH920_003626 [Catenulispora sp. EB89]